MIVLATGAGAGYAPVASGTVGTVVALPLFFALAAVRQRSVTAYATALVLVVTIAIWSAGRAEDIFGHDHSKIVIDEVAGLAVAGVFLPATWLAAALAFFLFRAFDVWKPWPARVFDEAVDGGLGVVGDDLVAGAYAGLASLVVLRCWP